jgi:hypothetical protein
VSSSGFRRGWPLCGAAQTEYCADSSDGKNGKKAGDARTNPEPGPFVFVELRHLIDRHARFASQELDGSVPMRPFSLISVHIDSNLCTRASVRRERCKPAFRLNGSRLQGRLSIICQAAHIASARAVHKSVRATRGDRVAHCRQSSECRRDTASRLRRRILDVCTRANRESRQEADNRIVGCEDEDH